MALRPALRPGALLLRRDATHLQIGTSPGIVLTDQPGLLALLRLLDGVKDIERLQLMAARHIPELRAPLPQLLTQLIATGAIVDASTRPPRRPIHTVGFDADNGCAPLVHTIGSMVNASDTSHVADLDPDLLVICSCGEASRSRFERATLLGTSHLLVTLDEDVVRIGPFVRPGQTPCITCYDLNRAMWDPAWPALVHQLGRPSTRATPGRLATTTAHAAAVEVAVEIIAAASGEQPRSAGRRLIIGPQHDQRVTQAIPFHPACACAVLSAA